jgi:sugar lactone lactonase YvrE
MTNDPRRSRARAPAAKVTAKAFALGLAALWSAAALAGNPEPVRIATGLGGGSGSTVGPDGALYVTEPATGEISRVNPRTGAVTTFATGLPLRIPAVGVGGAMDVEFLHGKAYALVTLVGADVGGTAVVGIYRMDGPNTFTPFADLGAFALANPPSTAFFVPTGVQYAMERYGNGFLVTDGHHNRVLRVTRDGDVSEFIAFGNIVPTGLAVAGGIVFMAEAGPTPHAPEDGKVVAFGPWRHFVWEVASGAPLLVDVELSRGYEVFALAQGTWDGVAEGSPALPFTGSLVRASLDGSLRVVADGLNIPTSLEVIGDTAYVVSLVGEIWRIDDISRRRPWW